MATVSGRASPLAASSHALDDLITLPQLEVLSHRCVVAKQKALSAVFVLQVQAGSRAAAQKAQQAKDAQ